MQAPTAARGSAALRATASRAAFRGTAAPRSAKCARRTPTAAPACACLDPTESRAARPSGPAGRTARSATTTPTAAPDLTVARRTAWGRGVAGRRLPPASLRAQRADSQPSAAADTARERTELSSARGHAPATGLPARPRSIAAARPPSAFASRRTSSAFRRFDEIRLPDSCGAAVLFPLTAPACANVGGRQLIWMSSMGPVRGRAVLVGLAGLCACARAGDGTNFRFPTDDGGLAGEVGSGDVGSSGSPDWSSGSSGSSSGANSGGSGSSDADAVASSGGGVACGPSCMGCCDVRGVCVAGLGDTACGAAGARCQDCTAIGTTCQAGGACTLGSSTGSSSGASSGSSSGASSEAGAGCRTGTSSSSCGRGTCAGCCDQAGNCHPGTSDSNCGSRSNCCADCNAANKTCNAGTCS
jgi:hypothetical protein